MSRWVRRAGRGRLPDGTLVVWSAAEGRNGRRWRSTAVRDGALERVLLLEVGSDGRPRRLEVATDAGLLTLHPHGFYREAHGNVVSPGGVRGFAFDWTPEHRFHVDGDPIAAAALVGSLGRDVPAGGERRVPALSVEADLAVRRAVVTVTRTGLGAWLVRCGADRQLVELDADGCPVLGRDARTWPLED